MPLIYGHCFFLDKKQFLPIGISGEGVQPGYLWPAYGQPMVSSVPYVSMPDPWIGRSDTGLEEAMAPLISLVPSAFVWFRSPRTMAGGCSNTGQQFLKKPPLWDLHPRVLTQGTCLLRNLGCPQDLFGNKWRKQTGSRTLVLTNHFSRQFLKRLPSCSSGSNSCSNFVIAVHSGNPCLSQACWVWLHLALRKRVRALALARARLRARVRCTCVRRVCWRAPARMRAVPLCIYPVVGDSSCK
jgi:hypothetical protein